MIVRFSGKNDKYGEAKATPLHHPPEP